jgi:NAD(P)-dependent dehydrogenase (short-subunit alcohol dehydrogenase family)
MDIRGKNILLLGGSGLVGLAIARELLPHSPARVVIAALRRDEAVDGVGELQGHPDAGGVEIVPEWGDIFLRPKRKDESRRAMLRTDDGRAEILDDLFGDLHESDFRRSRLFELIDGYKPEIVIDCVNTATAIAYQDLFTSASNLRDFIRGGGQPTVADVEAHLTTLYLPQLIRHVQGLMYAMRGAGTLFYLKIGTSGTGGMGLNIPFTHSEERPSPTLLSKASVAGAHSGLLFLMGRTPGGPVVKEVKPTAAVAWKKIGYGEVRRGGRPIPRVDCTEPLPVREAFGDDVEVRSTDLGESLESVYLDAGENGLFSLAEFETISALGMMEIITPEEIADAVISELAGRPTGRDIVGALDAATMGPTYRGGAMREAALALMEELEEEHGVRSVAFEMLGPPRLSKLLFEAEILRRLLPDLDAACELDPEGISERASRLMNEDGRLRSDIVSIGIPILLADGKGLLRGPWVSVEPEPGRPISSDWAHRSWVDLRPECWAAWKRRCIDFRARAAESMGAEHGSGNDLDVRSRSGALRPGALAGFVFRYEDAGERVKR